MFFLLIHFAVASDLEITQLLATLGIRKAAGFDILLAMTSLPVDPRQIIILKRAKILDLSYSLLRHVYIRAQILTFHCNVSTRLVEQGYHVGSINLKNIFLNKWKIVLKAKKIPMQENYPSGQKQQ